MPAPRIAAIRQSKLVAGAALTWLVASAAGAARLPSPVTPDPVDKVAVDGNGERLVLFYCADDASLNQNPGVVLEWSGSAWQTLSSRVTGQCHDPDVIISATEVAGIYLDDSDDLGSFCLGGRCTGGSGVNADGLRRVHTPRIGSALGFPYATYTQFQGGFARDRIFIDPLYPGMDPLANPPQTTGAFHCFPGPDCVDPVLNPTLAGTPTMVFAAYDVPGFNCMAVRWETETAFGDYLCIRADLSTVVREPELVVVDGRPFVAWREVTDGVSTAFVATYDGDLTGPGVLGDWRLIDEFVSDGAPWDRVRVATTGSDAYALYRRASELVVRRWNGGESWTTVWTETLSPYPTTPDIGVRGGLVYVAWRSAGAIEVEAIAAPEPSGALLMGGALATLAALRSLAALRPSGRADGRGEAGRSSVRYARRRGGDPSQPRRVPACTA